AHGSTRTRQRVTLRPARTQRSSTPLARQIVILCSVHHLLSLFLANIFFFFLNLACFFVVFDVF
ncbi:MAG: hypothetical protein AB7F32_12745, partial [Victivallaceae bacterium]